VRPEEPLVELERTEYVKVGAQHALLRAIVEAARSTRSSTRAWS
jgi:hypothetical protein